MGYCLIGRSVAHVYVLSLCRVEIAVDHFCVPFEMSPHAFGRVEGPAASFE